MKNINNILIYALILISLVLSVALLLSFQSSKKLEYEFNEKKALLMKENIDMKEKLNVIERQIADKAESINALEREKDKYEEDLNGLRKDFQLKMKSLVSQLDNLGRHKRALKKKIAVLGKTSLSDQLASAASRADNADIKKVLERSLRLIDQIREGKSVDLDSMMAANETALQEVPGYEPNTMKRDYTVADAQKNTERKGRILKFDPANNYIIINLGSENGVEKGERCKIFKDGQEVGSGEVMSVRFRISAVFIDTIAFKHTMDEVREGLDVEIERNREL